MKKLLIVLITIFAISNAYSQDYRRFKAGLHFGYVQPSGGGAGFGIALEPGFRITDKIAVNARLEGTFFTRDLPEGSPDGVEIGVAGIGSYTANAQYYFLDGAVRPYVAFGLGYYLPAEVEVTVETSSGSSSQSQSLALDGAFGFYPRIGVDIGHFNIVIDYNIVADSEVEQTTTSSSPAIVNGAITTVETTTTETVTFENSYLSVKLGFTIGGGRN